MAKAEVTYTYTTGEIVACIVTTKAEHPDALDQITTRARMLFAEVVEDMKLDEAEADTEAD